MATIVGGIATSHTPTIGFALDAKKHNDPVWAPIFAGYKPVQEWLARKKPDVLFVIYNDHITSFFFDHYSAFTLGIGEEFSVADEGGGARVLPPVPGNPKLAAHIAQSLVTDEFDLSYFQDKPLDHGFFSPMSVLLDREDGRWPTTIVPLQIGVLQFPIPTAARCYKMGKALRRAIEAYPEDIKVAIVSTGGLSHQVHGERAGFNNPEWDAEFLKRFTDDPASLTEMTHAEYAELGGFEGAEVIMWLMMRGALSDNVDLVHSSYYLPSMTGIATLVLNDKGGATPESVRERQRERMALQLKGASKLDGTYPFDIAASVKAYRINKYLHDMIDPDHRARFIDDPETSFKAADLTEEEKDLIRNRDWPGMIRYGVIFFMLEKLAAVSGVSNLHVYAAMRGQTLDEFLKTRNTQVMYSVAGNDAGKNLGAHTPATR